MKHFRKISHKSLAGFLMIWLSGIVFLFCCEMAAAQSLESEFCPLSKTQSHCDKAADNNLNTLSDQPAGSSTGCCAFLPAVFDKTRKIEKAQQPVMADYKLFVNRPRFILANDNREIPANYRATVLSQNNLHIRNCILRI